MNNMMNRKKIEYKIQLSRLKEFRTIVHSNDCSFASEEPCPKDENYVEGLISGTRQNIEKLRKKVKLWYKKARDGKKLFYYRKACL